MIGYNALPAQLPLHTCPSQLPSSPPRLQGVIGYDALVKDFLLAADAILPIMPDGRGPNLPLRLGEAPILDEAFLKLDDASVIGR